MIVHVILACCLALLAQDAKPTPTITGPNIYIESEPTLEDGFKFCTPAYTYGPDEVPVIVRCPEIYRDVKTI